LGLPVLCEQLSNPSIIALFVGDFSPCGCLLKKALLKLFRQALTAANDKTALNRPGGW
jgi:hypothetical protein